MFNKKDLFFLFIISSFAIAVRYFGRDCISGDMSLAFLPWFKAMKDGGIKISTIVVDGLDMNKASADDIKCFADFVKSEKMTAWFSYTNEAADLKGTLDADKLADFATVGHLAANGNALSLTILKNGDGKANLDAKTLLFTK